MDDMLHIAQEQIELLHTIWGKVLQFAIAARQARGPGAALVRPEGFTWIELDGIGNPRFAEMVREAKPGRMIVIFTPVNGVALAHEINLLVNYQTIGQRFIAERYEMFFRPSDERQPIRLPRLEDLEVA